MDYITAALPVKLLAANASYVQPGRDRFSGTFVTRSVSAEVYSDKAGTLYLEESDDNSSWTVLAQASVSAGAAASIPWTNINKIYHRLRYVNGATAQGVFKLVQMVSWKLADVLNAKVQLTGSTLQDTQTAPKSVPTNQAMKDIAMRAYENIIDIIGAENIKLLLPMWETSGTEFSDLLRPHVKFIAEGVTLGQSGLLHPVPSFDGVNDYVRQKPLTEATVSNSFANLDSPTKKLAQKLPAYALSGDAKFIMVWLQKTGDPVANLVVKLVEDNAGHPTGTVLATSEAITTTSLSATYARDHGLYFATPAEALRDKIYWVVMEYSSATTIDASNYVSWGYDSAGAYDQPRAVYDGASWTITTGQSHKFAIYSNDLTLSGDYSILVCAWSTNISNNGSLVSPAIGYNRSNSGTLSLSTANNRHNLIAFLAGGGTLDINKQILHGLTGFDLYGYTFSYADSSQKLKLYRGAELQKAGDGTANSGPNPPQQPFVIGAIRENWAGSWNYAQFFFGKIGPVIVTSNVLTQAQIGKIQNQLLALRRLREAV